MKKLFATLAFILLLPSLAYAVPVSWDGTTSLLQPLTSMRGAEIRGSYYTATSTAATSTFPLLSVSSAVNFLGDYVTNASTWIRSKFTGGDGLTYDNTTGDFDCDTASGSVFGCLTAADWTTFNNKQASGNYITALTGDVTASGPGSVAATLATVNSNVGTFGSATQAPQLTVNGKGLVTAVSNVTVTPAVGSITGLGTGVATWLATPSSANLITAVTDETGTGSLVFGTSPTFTTDITTPLIIGSTASGGDLTLQPTTNATDGSILISDGSSTWHELSTVAGTETVFNQTGADSDVRFETDTRPAILFIDASANRVMVGTTTMPSGVYAADLVLNGEIETTFGGTRIGFFGGYAQSSANGLGGIGFQPELRPAANIDQAYGQIGLVQVAAASSGTAYNITNLETNFYRTDTLSNYNGTISTVRNFNIGFGGYSSSSTVTNEIGLYVAGLNKGSNIRAVDLNVTSGTNDYNIYAGGTAVNYLAGNLGIADTTPTEGTMTVGGTLYVLTNTAVGSDPLCWDGSGGSLYGDCSSSGKYKDNVKSYSAGVADVLKLQPREFDWMRKGDGTLATSSSETAFREPDIGFVSEEVAKVNPDFVRWRDGEVGDIDERAIIAALVNTVKDQERRIEGLERRLSALEAK